MWTTNSPSTKEGKGGRSNIALHRDEGGRSGDGALHQHKAATLADGGSGEAGSIDYWEEVTFHDGSVRYYNHTTGDYFTSLTGDKDLCATKGQTKTQSPRESYYREEVPPSMQETTRVDGSKKAKRGDKKDPRAADDLSTARDEIRRALLVLYPAKITEAIVRAAMDGAIGHFRRAATVEAEWRRRSLRATRVEFRQNKLESPKVLGLGLGLFCNPSAKVIGEQGRGGSEDDEEDEPCSPSYGKAAGSADSSRISSTREREVISGKKLGEILNVLFTAPEEEARLTMRTIVLSSQGIGPRGAQELAPALSSCVIIALYLGNNYIGDRGVASLAEGLRRARGLQTLHLNDNEITDEGCHRLTNALGPLNVLSTLDLSHNPFGSKGCRSIANLLCQPGCPIRSLTVAGCLDIHPVAWKTISARGAERTRWDPPRPGDDGAVALAAALMSPHGCPLRHFRLANAGMRTIGVKAIAAALCTNTTLETLDLSGNDFLSKPDESAWESAAEFLSFGLKVNTRVHTVIVRACGLAREQVFAIRANASQRYIKKEARLLEGVDTAGDPCFTGQKKGPLPWREEKKLGFRASLLRDWLLNAARLQGIRYARPLSPDPVEASFSVKRTPRVREQGVGGAFTPSLQPHRRTKEICSARSSKIAPTGDNSSTEEPLVEPRLWSGLEALRRLIDAHDTVGFGRGSADDNSPGVATEAGVAIAEGVTLDTKRLPVLSEREGAVKQTLDNDVQTMMKPGCLSKVRQAVVSEEMVVFDPRPPAEGGLPAREPPDTEGTRSEAAMTAEGAQLNGVEKVYDKELDPDRSLPVTRIVNGGEQRRPLDPDVIHKKSRGGRRASVTSGDSGRIPRRKHGQASESPAASSPSPPRGGDIKSSTGMICSGVSKKAIRPKGEQEGRRLREATESVAFAAAEHAAVDNLAVALLDPNRPSAGQPQTCSTLYNRCHLTDDCFHDSATTRVFAFSDRERTGYAKSTDDMFAGSGEACAGTSVGERREGRGRPRGTTEGRGGDREVTWAALAQAIEDGRTIAAIAGERSRELDKSEMALLSASRELQKSRRDFLQTATAESSTLEAQLARARNDRDLTADRVRRLEPYVRSSNAMAEACEVELRAMQRDTRVERESKDGPRSLFRVGIDKLERLWRERVAHADELEREYFDAQQRLEPRFGDIDTTIAEMEASLRALRARSDEDGSSFRGKLEENFSLLAHISAKKNAMRGFSRDLVEALAVAVAKADEMQASAREERALRALVPAGSGRRDLDLQVATAVRETSKIKAEVDRTRNRRDQAMLELERARWLLLLSSQSGKSSDYGDQKHAASEQRASTCPARFVADDAQPPGFEEIPPACKNEQEAAVTRSCLIGETGRNTGVPRDQRGLTRQAGDSECAREGARSEDTAEARGQLNGQEMQRINEIFKPKEPPSSARVSATGMPHTVADEVASGLRTAMPPTAEELRKLEEAFSAAEHDHNAALARSEAPHIKHALALVRDHAVILHLAKKGNRDSQEEVVAGGGHRRPRGYMPLACAEVNSRVALGAKVATLQGTDEDDDEGNPILPHVDERGLTVGQRAQRLRDSREEAERKKRTAHAEYSRNLRRNLKARKSFVLAEREAGRVARTMGYKQLTEALRERGRNSPDSPDLEELRRAFVEAIRPEIRIRLHPSSRWIKSRDKPPRIKLEIMDVGEIAARRQQQLTASDSRGPSPQPSKPTLAVTNRIIRHAATA